MHEVGECLRRLRDARDDARSQLALAQRHVDALARSLFVTSEACDSARARADALEEVRVSLVARVEDYRERCEAIARERDEARTEVERLREEVESHQDAGGYAFRGGYIEDASGGRWWSAGLLSMREAEIEMLRGVGCREVKADEPESGPCGVCLRCAEERGAKWALDSVGWSHKDDRWSIAERVCRDARGK